MRRDANVCIKYAKQQSALFLRRSPTWGEHMVPVGVSRGGFAMVAFLGILLVLEFFNPLSVDVADGPEDEDGDGDEREKPHDRQEQGSGDGVLDYGYE